MSRFYDIYDVKGLISGPKLAADTWAECSSVIPATSGSITRKLLKSMQQNELTDVPAGILLLSAIRQDAVIIRFSGADIAAQQVSHVRKSIYK